MSRMGCLIILILGVLASVLGPTLPAAQVIPKVDYYSKSIAWDWVRGAPPVSGDATHFNVKCGPASGQYTYPVKRVDMPTKSILIKDAVPTQGVTYCIITAANAWTESKASVELPFDSGSAPMEPTNVRLQ